jgi:hypothetical protein
MKCITSLLCHSTHTYLRQALHMLLSTLSFLGNNRKKKGYGVAKLRSDRTNTSSFHLHLPLPVPHPTSRSRQPCSSRVFCTTFLSGNTILTTNQCISASVLFVCLFVLAFLNSSSWSKPPDMKTNYMVNYVVRELVRKYHFWNSLVVRCTSSRKNTKYITCITYIVPPPPSSFVQSTH